MTNSLRSAPSLALGSLLAAAVTYNVAKKDRWAMIRCHKWALIRHVYRSLAIYNFARLLDKAFKSLPPPLDAMEYFPGGSSILDGILADGPDTYQKKASNRLQILSLMDCVCGLVPVVEGRGATPLVLDIGAGKALLTRAIYEALGRTVAAVALDSRRPRKGDLFYDPEETDMGSDDAPYTRLVADVRHLAKRTLTSLKTGRDGGVIAVTKHLCGGATDESLVALCSPPLSEFVGACCFAPCCHQKTRRDAYCNIPYLESLGFCATHIGMRGGVQDVDFKNFGMLISMSRATDLQEWEYKKSNLLKVLGFERARQLGRRARRILEEGRMRYLREHGFQAHLVRYCDVSVTGDNLAIIATRKTNPII